jgi:predicted TIM-barrel fold metal-dependent hydrolase
MYAKLTFVPLGSREPFPCKDIQEGCKRIIHAFGPERCVWGSNFPCKLWCPKISYSQHLSIFQDQMELTDNEQKSILGETSWKLWFSHRR